MAMLRFVFRGMNMATIKEIAESLGFAESLPGVFYLESDPHVVVVHSAHTEDEWTAELIDATQDYPSWTARRKAKQAAAMAEQDAAREATRLERMRATVTATTPQ